MAEVVPLVLQRCEFAPGGLAPGGLAPGGVVPGLLSARPVDLMRFLRLGCWRWAGLSRALS
ncbi:MAG: hypothetical protein QOE58_3515, partial [Actinomycetota bacterium]|nr:hypothetical protein [Actinomycetota bacterium]